MKQTPNDITITEGRYAFGAKKGQPCYNGQCGDGCLIVQADTPEEVVRQFGVLA